MADDSDDPKQSPKRPEGVSNPVDSTSPSAAPDEGERPPPEGVDEQCGQDEAAEAMARLGLEMTDLPDACHEARRWEMEAPRPQLRWFRRMFLSGMMFHYLAKRLERRGWEFKEYGNVGYLLSKDRKIGLMLWRGDSNTGKPHVRAQNASKRGADSCEAVNNPRVGEQMSLFDAQSINVPVAPLVPLVPAAPANLVDDDADEPGGLMPFGVPEEDKPERWVIVLRNKVSATIRFEAQVLGPEPVTPGGYIQRVILRILLPSVVLPEQAVPPVPAAAPIDFEVAPQDPPPEDDDKAKGDKG